MRPARTVLKHPVKAALEGNFEEGHSECSRHSNDLALLCAAGGGRLLPIAVSPARIIEPHALGLNGDKRA